MLLSQLEHEAGLALRVVRCAREHPAGVRDLVPREQRLGKRHDVPERQTSAPEVVLGLGDLG
jgi:hypothetical protein